MTPLKPIRVEIPPGELFDKIAILQIKCQRITEPERTRNVHLELEALESARDRCAPTVPGLSELVTELRQLNESLWDLDCPEYSPPYHVDSVVLESDRTSKPDGWADPEDFTVLKQEWAHREWRYRDEHERPVNPRGRTG